MRDEKNAKKGEEELVEGGEEDMRRKDRRGWEG